MPMTPRRDHARVYPLIGMLLALGAPGGHLVLEAIRQGRWPTPSWVLHQWLDDFATLAYMTVSTSIVFAFLGWLLGRQTDRLESAALADSLTGLANRRYLGQRLTQEIARALRSAQPLALMIIDVDRLKAINDEGGHAAGDRALIGIARAVQGTCRAMDLPVRYAGDEFAVLAPNTTAADGAALADRIRAAVKLGGFSVSIGVADLTTISDATADALIRCADAALYRAKTTGRDRTCVAAEVDGPCADPTGAREAGRDAAPAGDVGAIVA